MKMSSLLKISILLFSAGLVLALLLAFIYSGIYNIAASAGHFPVTQWVLETTMRNSVEFHAEEIEIPPIFEEAPLERGFRHYEDTCVMCHGAPGIEPEEWAKGLFPEPPDLAEAAEEWSPEEVYWIMTHGLKMTGMPAVGGPDYATDRWAIAAFVKKRLPEMSEQEYGRLKEKFGPEEQTKAGLSPKQSQGQAVFQESCAVCHFPNKIETKVGPGLKGLFDHELTPVEKVPVTVENIRERIKKGGQRMPSYSHIEGKDLEALIAYLQTL